MAEKTQREIEKGSTYKSTYKYIYQYKHIENCTVYPKKYESRSMIFILFFYTCFILFMLLEKLDPKTEQQVGKIERQQHQL